MRGRYVHGTWRYDPTLYAPPRYRRASGYDAFIPDPIRSLAVSLPGEVIGVVSDAETAIADLNRLVAPELGPLAHLLLRTESIGSSKVEGMQVDARTLARAEAKQEAGRTIGPQAGEILANIDAMELAVERTAAAGEVAPRDLLDIHAVLLNADTGSRMPGAFRTSQNWIGGNDYNPCGADFVPPPPEEVGRLIADLCAFCNTDALPPLIQAAIAHAQLETVHPFVDGNGRTGRALVQVILRRRGLSPVFVPPISVILATDKARYIEGLGWFREDRLAEWIELFAAAAARAAQLAIRYRGYVIDLQERWRQRLRSGNNPRADAAAWAIIDALPAHPIITIAIAVAATGRTRPAVANAIAELESSDVLIPVTDSKRNRAWEADGLLELIAKLEAAAP